MNKYAAFSEEAQRRFRRWWCCERKKAFDTEEAAYQKGQSVYQCPYCSKFHRTGAFAKLTALCRMENR